MACKVAENPASLCSSPYLDVNSKEGGDIHNIQIVTTAEIEKVKTFEHALLMLIHNKKQSIKTVKKSICENIRLKLMSLKVTRTDAVAKAATSWN
ncbi:hypothetical protein Tco_0819696 [Tanacetum coccineum]|uniref:Uncharacterized protein n=1 Tax=Tanacetum coccineum TaxID=301880 RepID=A0ABQ5AAC3_9ASTR